MTTTTKIRFTGESTNAQKAARDLAGSMREITGAAGRAAGSTLKMTAAVLGAESVVAGLRKAMQSVTQGVRDYLAVNSEAEQRVGALAERWQESRSAIGEYILGGENAAIITGTLTGLLDELGGASADVAERQRMVRNALAGVIEVMAIGAQVVGVLRVAFGGLQVAVAVAGRAFEALLSAAGALGAGLLVLTARPLAIVVDGLAAIAHGAERLGAVIGGPVERATAGLAASMEGMSATIDAALDSVSEHARASARGVVSAFDGLGTEIDEIGASTAAAYIEVEQLTFRLRNLAEETRSGASAQRSLRREIEATAAALAQAQQSAAVGTVQDAIRAAQTAAMEALAAKEAALAEQSANNSEAKADRIIAAEERIAAVRAAAMLAAEEQEARFAELMARRVEVAQGAGAAVGESLIVAVQAQKDASKQIVSILARELAARIAAAVATAGIFAATPGGQFFAAAIGAAATAAAAALSSIGGGGKGGGGKGGGGTSIGAVNVSVYNQGGAQSDTRSITAAVEEGIRRGTIRMRNA